MIALIVGYCAVASYLFGVSSSPGIDNWKDTVLFFAAAWLWPLTFLVLVVWNTAIRWKERAK